MYSADKQSAMAVNYARQAIKSRLEDLEITMPPSHLDDDLDMISKIRNFKDKLSELSAL